MSRRPPNPAADRAAQNQQTIKSLLKLEANKVCADCKRNKHPRWASWNLGVFICIRCSGIHRGMGTHISRVKSVDLDSWTDEQLKSILSWGNARANKYWEAKLNAGHVPSEAKIENFIRTKYELKRWVMDGPMPDPATLDAEGDDDVPLSVVKEKQDIDRRESVRKASVGRSAAPAVAPDLIGADAAATAPPPRASTTGPTTAPGQVPPKSQPAPPKASTKDSLLGLDFLGAEPAAPPRPASTTGSTGSTGPSRPDLKQSILSLYASAPRPPPAQPAQPPAATHSPTGSFSGLPSPGQPTTQGSLGGLSDAFSSLSFGASAQPKSPPPPPAQKDVFSGLASVGSRPAPQTNHSSAFSGLSGGSFFDPKPAHSAPAPHQPRQPSGGALGGFGSLASPAATPALPTTTTVTASSSSALNDLFDLSTPASPPPPAASSIPSIPPTTTTTTNTTTTNSVFNLSATQPKPAAQALAADPLASHQWPAAGGADVWGGNAWATPDPPQRSPEIPKVSSSSVSANTFGWATTTTTSSLASQPIVPGATGGFSPKVAADEEFGGWTSSTGGSGAAAGATSKPAGAFGAPEDLFSNVWQ